MRCNGDYGSGSCGLFYVTDSLIAHNIAKGGKGGDFTCCAPAGWGGIADGGGLIYDCVGDRLYCQETYLIRVDVHHNVAQAGDGGETPIPFWSFGPTDGYGGGLYLTSDFQILGSEIHHNQARASQLYMPSSPYDWTTSKGGGILSVTHLGKIVYSSVWQNTADLGGGIAGLSGGLTATNSTVSQNIAHECGGAVFTESGVIPIFNYSTLVQNTAHGNGNPRRCGGSGAGGGFYGTIRIYSSLLAINNAPSNDGSDCVGWLYSEGFNLIGDTSNCNIGGSTTGNILNADPLLGPLQDNGGRTPTHALLAGSVAIDAAAPADCPATDQRNFARWVDGNGDGIARCDMGAYEYGGAPTDVGLVGTIRGRSASISPLLLSLLALTLLFYRLRRRTTNHVPYHDPKP